MALFELDVVKTIKEELDNQKTSTTFDKIWGKSKIENRMAHGFRKVYVVPLIVIFSCVMMFTAGFASYQYLYRTIDRTDYTFVEDTNIIGKWKTVNYVEDINAFQPGIQSSDDVLYLKELVFIKGGKMLSSVITGNGSLADTPYQWTKGKVINKGQKTSSAYVLKDINGKTFLFVQWKEGDYIVNGGSPWYYVLEKADDLDYENYDAPVANQDKIDYPFEDEPLMHGNWESVDIVEEIDHFKPDARAYLNDLYVTNIEISDDGELDITATDSKFSNDIIWTRGMIIDRTLKTASKCILKEIDGITYMFFEWKNDDYRIRGWKPGFYVLKKVD